MRAPRVLRSVAVAMALMLTACRLSTAEFHLLDAWFTCDECVNNERAKVVALGWKGISRLDAALIGPSPGRIAVMNNNFRESYRTARSPGPNRQQDYITFRRDNYIATYQKRAAVALGDIAKSTNFNWLTRWRARRALDNAMHDAVARHYRADVVQVIRFVRQSLDAPPFKGVVQPNPSTFGALISVVASNAEPFNKDETAQLDSSLFQTSEVPVFWSMDTLKTYAVATAGPHLVTVTNVGSTTNRELAALLIRSNSDPNDDALRTCTDGDTPCIRTRAPPIVVSAGQPFVAFLSFSRKGPVQDTLDFLKITAPVPGPLSLTATLNWRDSSNLDLSWHDCITANPRGNYAGATLANPEITSVSIPGGECWILQIGMRPTSLGPTFARLEVKSP